MMGNERIEADALSRRLDGLLAGVNAPSDLDPELDAFAQLVVEVEQVPPLDPARKARLWANALRLAVEANARGWRPRGDGASPVRFLRPQAAWLPRGWRIIPAIAALLLMAAIAYATASPVLQRMIQETWQRDPGLAAVEEAGHVADLNQSITRDGITITLQRAYMDGNQVVIGYTIEGPESLVSEESDRNPARFRPLLFDADGRHYMGGATSGTGEGNMKANVSRFDATGLPPDVQEVTFDLRFPYIEAERPEDILLPTPWSFRFTMPVIPGHVIESPGAVTVRDVRVDCVADSEECARLRGEIDGTDVTITLLRVLSSPSELRVDLAWNPMDIPRPEGGPAWAPFYHLEGASCAVPVWPPPRPPGDAPRSQVLGYPDGTQERRLSYPPGEPGSECTFTVSELVADRQELQRGDTCCRWNYRIPGPWVFHFRLPSGS